MRKSKNDGLFITFEGGEGCGKSTVMEEIANYFKQKIFHFAQQENQAVQLSVRILEKLF